MSTEPPTAAEPPSRRPEAQDRQMRPFSAREPQKNRAQAPITVDRGDGLVLAAGLLCALGYLLTSPSAPLPGLDQDHQLLQKAVQWAGFAVAVAAVHRAARRRRTSLLLVVLIAAACQLPGLLSPPQTSTDAYRYVWDGRVQLAGTSPYRYVPLDDHLARLRDPVLFPGLTPRQPSGVRTLAAVPTDPAEVAALVAPDPRTVLNRPRVPTIYPPVAQAWFTAVAALTPWPAGTLGLQLAAALLALALTAGIGAVLRRRGRDPGAAIYWGWSPVAVLETGNGAHVDVLAAGLIVAAMVVLDRPGARARLAGGVLLGLAVATKIIPLLLLPVVTLLRRPPGPTGPGSGRPGWWWRGPWWRGLVVPATATGTVLLSYLPHLLVAGSLVLGYLPGYLTEEGFSDGSNRYEMLALVLPRDLRQPVAVLLMLVLVTAVLARATPRRPELAAVWMYGGSLLISTPAYSWYCLPLLALAALARRPEWLAVALATEIAYIEGHTNGPVGWAYLAAALVVLALTLRRRARRPAVAIDAAVELAPPERLSPANTG